MPQPSRRLDQPRAALGSVLIYCPEHYIFDDQGGYGAGPYADLAIGASVVITDDHGVELARTTLEAGSRSESGFCRMRWMASIPDRPAYRILVADRPARSMDRRQMQRVDPSDEHGLWLPTVDYDRPEWVARQAGG